MVVIAIVGLIVIGPDKLPETIRTVMLWFGRIKRTVTDTRTEFEQQLGLDEIRRELHNEQILKALAKIESNKNTIKNEADNFEEELKAEIEKIGDDVDDTATSDETAEPHNPAQHENKP